MFTNFFSKYELERMMNLMSVELQRMWSVQYNCHPSTMIFEDKEN